MSHLPHKTQKKFDFDMIAISPPKLAKCPPQKNEGVHKTRTNKHSEDKNKTFLRDFVNE